MNKTILVNKLNTIRNGAYINISYVSDLTPNKDNQEHKIQKLITSVIRLGVAYSHINDESIKERQNDNAEHKLPWGVWDEECPYIINHKGNSYLRCTISNSPYHHHIVEYLLDGVKVTKEDIANIVRESELKSSNKKLLIFNVNIKNIISLGKEE